MRIPNPILTSLLLAVGFLLLACDDGNVRVSTGGTSKLYIKQFVAVDAETGEVLTVSVSTPSFEGNGSSISMVHEINHDQTHRITCMCWDVPVFTLSLDGYVETKVPLDVVTGILFGSIETEHVEMRKI